MGWRLTILDLERTMKLDSLGRDGRGDLRQRLLILEEMETLYTLSSVPEVPLVTCDPPDFV
jgi:hypothetical protein